jgi:hypothetical protein
VRYLGILLYGGLLVAGICAPVQTAPMAKGWEFLPQIKKNGASVHGARSGTSWTHYT